MASKRLRMLLASGLLAVAAAFAGTSGAAFAGAPGGTPGPLTVCEDVSPNFDSCCLTAFPNGVAPAELSICCIQLVSYSVVPAGAICPTPSPTATATETPTATPTSTAFESFQGETATPAQNTPPPTTTGSGSSNGSLPLFALLICLAFGAIGLAAVADQRRRVRR